MSSAPDILADAVERALRDAVGPENAGPAIIRPCADPKFGDYQANGVMALAKRLGQNPRGLAEQVIADLHLGDWGTQFGMLILGWKKFRDDAALRQDAIGELERLYKYVNAHEELRDEAKAELVKLQQGDVENQEIWQKTIDLSVQE